MAEVERVSIGKFSLWVLKAIIVDYDIGSDEDSGEAATSPKKIENHPKAFNLVFF